MDFVGDCRGMLSPTSFIACGEKYGGNYQFCSPECLSDAFSRGEIVNTPKLPPLSFDDVYAASRAAFDATAGMDYPEVPSDPWGALQTRLYRWQVNTYGLPQPALLCLGVVEEMGEWWESPGQSAALDAVADITIFAIQLATCYRLDIGTLIAGAHPDPESADGDAWMMSAGALCHVVLKSEQGIRGLGDKETSRRAVAKELILILGLCLDSVDNPADYLHLVEVVAGQVMARKKAELPQVVR